MILYVFTCLFAVQGMAKNPGHKMDQYLRILTKQDRFCGTVLVVRDKKVLLRKGYGPANRDWEIPNTPGTRFRIGSITKQFTAAAILLLQERGKLSTRDAIGCYLPDCPAAWKDITIQHLLTHTGGIPDLAIPPEKNASPMTVQELIATFKDKPLLYAPGEKGIYCNADYVLLGAIIEKLSGLSYAQFLQENIFTPLEMTNTGYDSSRQVLKGRAAGYICKEDTIIIANYLDMSIPYAAGALYSTVDDLYRWRQALFGGKLLSAKSLDEMLTPTANSNNYAYGIVVGKQFNRNVVFHGGRITGFNSYLTYYPNEKLTIIFLLNQDIGLDPLEAINRDLAAIVLGEKYTMPKSVQNAK